MTAALAASALALGGATKAEALDVVASIKPVHSLVAAVMKGVGDPSLIVKGAGSPHVYSMRPSEASALEGADLVFWVGPDLEAFLRGPLDTLAGEAKIVELDEAPGLVLLPQREGGAFEAHHHHGEDHAAHETDHAHATDEHGEDGEEAADHGREGHSGEEAHHHDETNVHVWLDPENARAMVHAIEHALAEADPANAETYEANAEAVDERLSALTDETAKALDGVEEKPFIVFHDAYYYFENRFDLKAVGSITVSPEAIPGAARVAEIRSKIEESGAKCVFAEPQFEPRLIDVVTEGTGAKTGVLDPLGADIADGPDLYFELIRRLAGSLGDCLSR